MKNKTSKHKLSKDQKSKQEHARVWIESNILLREHGFTPGRCFEKVWNMGKTPVLELHLLEEDDITTGYGTVSERKGKRKGSIIDITGWTVKQFFEGSTHIEATYKQGLIEIRGIDG